jgi:hypothetical protein
MKREDPDPDPTLRSGASVASIDPSAKLVDVRSWKERPCLG